MTASLKLGLNGDCRQIVNSDEYKLVTKDVSIVRAPPSDTLLGGLMQGATVALQLSTREGFEVKVSEAVLKRIPIVATNAGGKAMQADRKGESKLTCSSTCVLRYSSASQGRREWLDRRSFRARPGCAGLV